MEAFEKEVETYRELGGVDPSENPLRWIKWETPFRTETGVRAPPWREALGDAGYLICSTHDQGFCVILCKKNGRAFRIKGYTVNSDGNEELDYTPVGPEFGSIKDTLADFSKVFADTIDTALRGNGLVQMLETTVKKGEDDANLLSLPQEVLVLTSPINDSDRKEGVIVQEDDEPLVQFPKSPPGDNEYWIVHEKMKSFVRHSSDPLNRDLQDIASNSCLREEASLLTGIRAVLDSGALPAMIDVLKVKEAQHMVEVKQNSQADAVMQILGHITVSPNIRRHMASADVVKVFLEMLAKEEPDRLGTLFTIIANCARNTNFRELFVSNEGVDQLVFQIKVSEQVAAKVCFVLYTLNRSEKTTQVLKKCHIIREIQRYYTGGNTAKLDHGLRLSLTRLLYSAAYYDKEIKSEFNREQMQFFCQGLQAAEPELVMWSAKVFTVFVMNDELQKAFCSKMVEGPLHLIHTLDNPRIEVILAGLSAISVVAESPRLRQEIVTCPDGVLSRLKRLWTHENQDVKLELLHTLGVLSRHKECAEWTARHNILPDLVECLHSANPDFVVYSARAIGSCCTEKANLTKLMEMNGVRILWSLMKSPYSKVQAATTRALVPFLQSEGSPAIVRTFVDGLELLVSLLKSNDPDVQASACMAITEVAKDQENLAVMTDLGLVELLSRLLSTNSSSVRKPLADAIGIAATWGNNRRKFGEEGAVDPLVKYLTDESIPEVHPAGARALRALSEDVENSNRLRQEEEVVKCLLDMVSSRDSDLQMAAAVAIRNIRTNCYLEGQ